MFPWVELSQWQATTDCYWRERDNTFLHPYFSAMCGGVIAMLGFLQNNPTVVSWAFGKWLRASPGWKLVVLLLFWSKQSLLGGVTWWGYTYPNSNSSFIPSDMADLKILSTAQKMFKTWHPSLLLFWFSIHYHLAAAQNIREDTVLSPRYLTWTDMWQTGHTTSVFQKVVQAVFPHGFCNAKQIQLFFLEAKVKSSYRWKTACYGSSATSVLTK